jgi:hypothetical protein
MAVGLELARIQSDERGNHSLKVGLSEKLTSNVCADFQVLTRYEIGREKHV